MLRRRFIPCLNQPRKIYNFTSGALIGAVSGLLLIGLSVGLLYGLGAGLVGLAIGNWLAGQIYQGKIQRFVYWYCPYAKYWLGSNIPESAAREEL